MATKLLPELGLTQALQEGLLLVYDDHTQEVNTAVFGAIYPKGAAPYAQLLRQLGVERCFGANEPGARDLGYGPDGRHCYTGAR